MNPCTSLHAYVNQCFAHILHVRTKQKCDSSLSPNWLIISTSSTSHVNCCDYWNSQINCKTVESSFFLSSKKWKSPLLCGQGMSHEPQTMRRFILFTSSRNRNRNRNRYRYRNLLLGCVICHQATNLKKLERHDKNKKRLEKTNIPSYSSKVGLAYEWQIKIHLEHKNISTLNPSYENRAKFQSTVHCQGFWFRIIPEARDLQIHSS